MSQLFAGGAVFLALALLIYVLATRVEERSTVRATLRQLDDYQLENEREKELLDPFQDRIVSPVLEKIIGVGRKFWPSGYAENAKRKLVVAGKPTKVELDRFLAVRVLTIATIPVWGVLTLGHILPLAGKLPLVLFAFFALAAVV